MPFVPLWYLAWGLPWAVIAAWYAHGRSRNPVVWAILGFFLSFVAVIAIWIMGDGAWHRGGGSAEEDDFEDHRAGETTQEWRTPPSSSQAAAAAWWTSADAGSLGHRSGDRQHRS